mmetsp:Transcript_124778/g.233379  ORF Transcript_124778/g.233379 Transcript_124778/m.233379 type:complete len:345 (+) Transcript_124778:39-1073(+)
MQHVGLLLVSAAFGCHGWHRKFKRTPREQPRLVDDVDHEQAFIQIDSLTEFLSPLKALATLLVGLRPLAAFGLSGPAGHLQILNPRAAPSLFEFPVRYASAVLQELSSVTLAQQSAPGPMFWPINLNFPGLEKVFDEPAIYVVDDLLSAEMCEALIAKAEPRLRESRVQTLEGLSRSRQRTSSEMTMGFEEVPGLQRKFSELLNMNASQLEPLKVTRYEAGQEFQAHLDCQPEGFENGTEYCQTPYCNRVVTLFVYLRDCDEGGATRFQEIGMNIQPTRGMGVIHFPARTPIGGGKRDERTLHSGEPAIDKKYICQQWAWSGPLDRDKIQRTTTSDLQADNIIL